jgi:6,7-dimethyl-8-ribityllumazine synthase
MAAPKRKPVAKAPKQPPGARILVVEARYYNHIADALLQGATAAINEAGAAFDRVEVPGALEIPAAIIIAVEAARKKKTPYDGVVALGCVIQGETFHFDIVAMQSARALIDLSVAQQLPAGNGILTVDNEAQALKRADPMQGNKGGEAARAALALARLKRQLARPS